MSVFSNPYWLVYRTETENEREWEARKNKRKVNRDK